MSLATPLANGVPSGPGSGQSHNREGVACLTANVTRQKNYLRLAASAASFSSRLAWSSSSFAF